ncbi:X-Pro dipeptidyl-peptidase, partial [Undibacterium sp. 10I3]|nr:X-Pro dipeptidyl-peptidase [Undibacterium sp. 10I3]
LGHVDFQSKTGEYYRKNILLPFFEQYLKGVSNQTAAVATVFETGTNVWRRYASWPPQQVQMRRLYLGAGGSLSWQTPTDAAPA